MHLAALAHFFLSLSLSLQCDFGLSRSLGDNESVTASIRDVNPRWVAPEIFKDEVYSVLADLYSAGVRCYYFGLLSPFYLVSLSSDFIHPSFLPSRQLVLWELQHCSIPYFGCSPFRIMYSHQ